MGAACAEFDDAASCGLFHDSGGFGRDQGLECQRGEKVGFRYLRLDQRGMQHQDRLTREEDGSFGDGEDIAREVEIAQVSEKSVADLRELRECAEIADLGGGEMEI